MVRTPSAAQVIAVASGKGGVGKTNLALNLGVCLSSCGVRTILLDADFGHANADILLNITPRADLLGLLDPTRPIRDLLTQGPENLQLLCGITGLRHERRICESDPQLYIDALDRLRQSCSILLIDCAAGAVGPAASFVLCADVLLLVTTPEPTSIADSYATLKLLFQRGFCARAAVLVNMARRELDAVDATRRLQRVAHQFLGLSLESLGHIPSDRHVVEAVRLREAFVTRFPRCPASLRVSAAARRLSPLPGAADARVDTWGRVASLFF